MVLLVELRLKSNNRGGALSQPPLKITPYKYPSSSQRLSSDCRSTSGSTDLCTLGSCNYTFTFMLLNKISFVVKKKNSPPFKQSDPELNRVQHKPNGGARGPSSSKSRSPLTKQDHVKTKERPKSRRSVIGVYNFFFCQTIKTLPIGYRNGVVCQCRLGLLAVKACF